MSLSIENYVPQMANNRFSSVVWLLLTSAIGLWCGSIIAAPFLKINNLTVLANSIYTFFSYLCHQQSERSFHFHNESFAVCARCFGVYFGLAAGVLIYPFVRSLNNTEPLPRIWLLLAPLPTTVDFLLGVLGIWENTHLSRFLTATVLGLACAFFLVPGVLEISRYLLSQQLAINSQPKK